jgi:hypothetical protein
LGRSNPLRPISFDKVILRPSPTSVQYSKSLRLACSNFSGASDGAQKAESTSMMAGALALFLYSSCVSRIMMHRTQKALWVAVAMLPVWFTAAFGLL